MKLSSQIKPISYLKAHAAEIVRNLGEQGESLVITQNGEAKVVIQDIKSYEQTLSYHLSSHPQKSLRSGNFRRPS